MHTQNRRGSEGIKKLVRPAWSGWGLTCDDRPTGNDESGGRVSGPTARIGHTLQDAGGIGHGTRSSHPFVVPSRKQFRSLSFSLYVDVKELRDGLPERVVALHARPQEFLANANFFHVGDRGWTYGAADQGFRENQRLELTERGI